MLYYTTRYIIPKLVPVPLALARDMLLRVYEDNSYTVFESVPHSFLYYICQHVQVHQKVLLQ